MLMYIRLVWRWASSSDSWAYASVSGLGASGLDGVRHGRVLRGGRQERPLVPGPRKMSLMGRSGISGCRSRSGVVLAQRVPLELLVQQDAAQIRVAVEADAVEVERRAAPTSWRPGRAGTSEGTTGFASVTRTLSRTCSFRGDRVEEVDDLEARIVLGQVQPVHGVDGAEELEVQLRVILQERGDLRQVLRMDDGPGAAGPVDVALRDRLRKVGGDPVQRECAQGGPNGRRIRGVIRTARGGRQRKTPSHVGALTRARSAGARRRGAGGRKRGISVLSYTLRLAAHRGASAFTMALARRVERSITSLASASCGGRGTQDM